MGFGPGAVSTVKNKRWKINPSLHSFLTDSDILKEEETLSEETILFERIMLLLRTSQGVPESLLSQYSKTFLTPEEQEKKKKRIAFLIKNNFLHSGKKSLYCTNKGFNLYNEIVSQIL